MLSNVNIQVTYYFTIISQALEALGYIIYCMLSKTCVFTHPNPTIIHKGPINLIMNVHQCSYA